MLVLSRKKEERIRIGDDIKIVVVEIRGDKVRLGIDAPRHIDVHREEIWCTANGKDIPAIYSKKPAVSPLSIEEVQARYEAQQAQERS